MKLQVSICVKILRLPIFQHPSHHPNTDSNGQFFSACFIFLFILIYLINFYDGVTSCRDVVFPDGKMAKSLPDVIKFVYNEFKVNDSRKTVTAKCKKWIMYTLGRFAWNSSGTCLCSSNIHESIMYSVGKTLKTLSGQKKFITIRMLYDEL
jgi:hypothetical protein